MFSPLINKTPVNRLPSTTYIQPQQQWYSSTPQQFNPPPNYSTATRARHPMVITQQTQNQQSPQTLLAPLRSNTSTPPPTYIARPGSTPNLIRPTINSTISISFSTTATILRPLSRFRRCFFSFCFVWFLSVHVGFFFSFLSFFYVYI